MEEREERPPADGIVIPPRPPLPERPSAPDDATVQLPHVLTDAAPQPDDATVQLPHVPTDAAPASHADIPTEAITPPEAHVIPDPTGPETTVLEPLSPPVEPEATTLPLPVVGAPDPQPVVAAPAEPKKPKRKHRGRAAAIWIVASIVVLGVVAVVGWFAGEAWAQKAVTAEVQRQTAKALGISDSSSVQVSLQDPVLPQVIGGSLSTVDVTAPGAPIGGATGTVKLHATHVATRGGGQPSSATASVSMTPEAITTLAGSLGDTVPGSLQVVGSNLAVTLNPAQFLSRVTVVVTFTPSVANGQLVLTPSAFQVGTFDMSLDTVRQRFGALAGGMLAPRTVCVASAFPKGMTLTGIQLSPSNVTADFSVDPAIMTDPTLQAKGTCG